MVESAVNTKVRNRRPAVANESLEVQHSSDRVRRPEQLPGSRAARAIRA